MPVCRTLTAAALSLIAVAGGSCKRREPPVASGAAKVANAVKEADLAVITITPEAERRLGVETVPVARRALPITRLVPGEITTPDGLALNVAAPVAGTLTGAVASAGRRVARGQVLGRIVPIQAADRDQRIDADREAATAAAAVQNAQRQLARAERMVKDGSGSRRAVDDAQAALATAQASLAAARGRQSSAASSRITGGALVVRSPVDGVILAAHAASGQGVGASAALFSIARLDRMWVRVPVFAGDAPRVDTAKGADVLRLGDPSDAPGVRARAATGPPRADPNAASIDLTFELVNPGTLTPGERVFVRVTERGEVEGLVVPDSAILRDEQGGTWVYERIRPQQFARRRIEIRQTADTWVLLARGPAAGALIVSVGTAELFGVEFGAGK